jgi:hypothetical protein
VNAELATELQEPSPDCWLHPGVVVRDSPIEGDGLFATVPIAAGEVVSRLGGRLLTDDELNAVFATSDHYVDTISVAEGVNLLLPDRQHSGYGNHSCDPNAWWSDAYTLVARRDIAPGEEVVNDYGASTADPHWAMQCSCGSVLCRGVVTGDDWRRHDLRERYGEHWTPVLRNRIEAARREGERAADLAAPLA